MGESAVYDLDARNLFAISDGWKPSYQAVEDLSRQGIEIGTHSALGCTSQQGIFGKPRNEKKRPF